MVRCIFCKQDSKESKSVEHIIPESLGNNAHTLPSGMVCDTCNNYFARKVEQPFLEHPVIKLLRFEEGVENKKGNIPPTYGVIFPDAPVEVRKKFKDGLAGEICVSTKYFCKIANMQSGQIIIPMFTDELPFPNGSLLSRFIGKIAIEALAQRLQNSSKLVEDFIDNIQLDPLRNHVRFGKEKTWECNVRRIYESTKFWRDESTAEIYQITNEYDFLATSENEWYFVMALFGIEFVINIAEMSIAGYKKWLMEHDNSSPLFL